MSGRDGGTGEGSYERAGRWQGYQTVPTSDADPACTSASEVEAMCASMGRAKMPDGYPINLTTYERRQAAQALLASDWLRDRDAAAANRGRAEGLREAADALGSGPKMPWLYERESCDWWGERRVSDWLRDRAGSLDAAPRGDGAGA